MARPACPKCRGFLSVDTVYYNHVETECFAKCLNCGWLGQMKAPQVDDHIEMEVVHEMPKRIDKCKGCGRKAEIQGRGKCGSCYQAELRAEKANKEAVMANLVKADDFFSEPAAVEAPIVKAPAAVLDFPRTCGLDALLNYPGNHQMLLDLPDDVFQSLADYQITAADIIELLRDLVNLRLRRVAA